MPSRLAMRRNTWMISALALHVVVAAWALSAKPAAAVAGGGGFGPVTSYTALPRLPQMVWQLYLPEEYQACGVAYGLYARLPEADRARLHAGTKITLDASTLTRDQTRVLSAWFNSARWGCDPPAEKLDSDGVRRSTVVLKCEDSVVEFCPRSPEKGNWKKLTIACAPERAEWVRDGLPLPPHWYYPEGWTGGMKPPEPKPSPDAIRIQENCFRSQGRDPGPAIQGQSRFLRMNWLVTRAVYRVYAQLPPGKLRELHQQRELRIHFRDLPSEQQDSLAEAVDTARLSSNIGFRMPLDYGRPPDALSRHYGIKEVVFEYRRQHPGLSDPELAVPGVDPCPRPFRRVFVNLDTRYPRPPKEMPGWEKAVFRVAMPLQLQRSLLAWQRSDEAWMARWMYYEGNQGYVKRGAPPRPRHPAD